MGSGGDARKYKMQVSDFSDDARRDLADAEILIENAVKVAEGWEFLCPKDRVGDVVGIFSSHGARFYRIDPVRPDAL